MRSVSLGGAVAAISGVAFGVAQAADVYAPPPAYRAPPRVYVQPPRYVVPVPVVPLIVERPVGIFTVPEGWAYVVPEPVYQPGHEYVQSPVLHDARHYRACWHEWGQLRCTLRPRW